MEGKSKVNTNDELKLSGSEQLTLATRGYKVIKKVNEGSYAKVIYQFTNCPKFSNRMLDTYLQNSLS